MKKWTFPLLGLAAFVLLVFFFMWSSTERYTPVENTEEAFDGIAQTISTQVGDTFKLTMPNDTERYTWRAIFNDVYVSLEDTEQNERKTIFVFEAQLQGATDISFVYESEDGDVLEEQSTRVEIR